MRWGLAVVVLAACVNSGCWFRNAKAAPPLIAAPPSTRTTTEPPPQVPPPPPVETPQPQVPAPPQVTQSPLPRPVPPPKPARNQKKVVGTPVPVPEPVVAAPVAPPPQLTQMLSPAEQISHNRSIDEAMRRAEMALATVGSRRLSASQRTTLERVKMFLKQAAEARATDLVTAKSLAERADALASDLARNLR